MYFLVKGEVKVSPYMGELEDEKVTEVLRLVEAPDEDKAEQAFTEFFEFQTDEYVTYYSVR